MNIIDFLHIRHWSFIRSSSQSKRILKYLDFLKDREGVITKYLIFFMKRVEGTKIQSKIVLCETTVTIYEVIYHQSLGVVYI